MRPPLAFLILALITCHVPAATAAPPDAVLPNGDRYYGPLKNGLLDGTGRLVSPTGALYQGSFVRGQPSGQGRLRLPDGSHYEGSFKNGQFDGHGVWHSLSGAVFEGTFSKGSIVTGTWHQGKRHYKGHFRNWHFSGKGTYVDANGNVTAGTFANGHPVRGDWRDDRGDVYEGQFRGMDFNGRGRYMTSRGSVYRGSFHDSVFTGPGVFTDPRGNSYIGEFRDWRFDGFGAYLDVNGQVYVGHFSQGHYDGWGLMMTPTAGSIIPRLYLGTWIDGERKGHTWHDRAVRVAAQALYSQPRLLDAQLDALRAATPGRINMYLVTVAGDGSEEVFRREAEYVNRQFGKRFGTRGHSVVLANSRTSASRLPMATEHSLQKTLEAVASKMDPNRDILFLYMTSHGSHDHRLELDEYGIELADLKARTLGRMLRALHLRNKVVVISACFSGGFIKPLDDGHTLIMTAARADRTSFGCADENQFTYFGRAFFKESVPRTGSFVTAFDKAKGLVRQWENKLDTDHHSHPQILHSPSVETQLRRWRQQLDSQKAMARKTS